MAFNTPFKMWKRYEFNGGTCDPCIISWPAGTKARGEIRDQYHHAIDIVPTILDILGVERARDDQGPHADAVRRRQHARQPRRRLGRVGRARRSSTRCSAPARSGTRAGRRSRRIRRIAGWGHFNDDEWELYHTDVDRSELQQPRRRAAGQAAGAREHLVLRGRRERRLPARRPLAGRDPDDPAPAADRAARTATCTSRARRRSASGRRSTRATARS